MSTDFPAHNEASLRIAVVGPCASGKSTLAESLRALGYDARQIAQEHSYVPDMWQRINKPDLLIFLDASLEACNQRKDLHLNLEDYREQGRRLEHARKLCDIFLTTDELSAEQVLRRVLAKLEDRHPSSSEV